MKIILLDSGTSIGLAQMTSYMTVNYNSDTIFIHDETDLCLVKDVTFNDLSIDFIMGFGLACQWMGDESITIVDSTEFSNESTTVLSNPDADYVEKFSWREDILPIKERYDHFNQMCSEHNIVIYSKYAAVIDQIDTFPDIIQFDS